MNDTTRPTRHRRLLSRFPRAVPVLIFLLVASVTGLSVFSIEQGERQREAAEMARRAQALGAAVERRASTSAAFLRSGAALFTVQERVDASLFRRFVAELRLDSDYQGSEGIGWAPVIDAADVGRFEAEINANRVAPVRVYPSLSDTPREQLTPILYLQPDTLRNRRALGFDMYSEPVRRAAMDEAARAMRPTASGRIVLVQDGGKAPEARQGGFLIYMPVFDTSRAGRQLKGFIYSPFNAGQFLESAADLVGHEGIGIDLFDIDQDRRVLLAQVPGAGHKGLTVQRQINLANRAMILSVRSDKDPVLSPMSMITLLFGIAVASLLMLIARLLTQQADEDRRSLDWFSQQNSIRDSLTRELNHRVKNTLANVLSIVALTRRRATNLDDFAEGIDGRIRALSATHDLLTQSDWSTTPVRSVAEVELAPYTKHEGHEVVLTGPDVELAPNDALSLGLALHELATNAAKFGSLSIPDGRVSITWDMVGETLARVRWVESGGPQVNAPTKRGFGTDLLEKIVAHELRHPVEIDFDEAGVRSTLLVPVRRRSEFELREKNENARGH